MSTTEPGQTLIFEQPVRVWKRKPEMARRRVEHPGLFEEQSKRWVNSLGPWFEPCLAGLPLADCHWLHCSPFCHPKGEPKREQLKRQ